MKKVLVLSFLVLGVVGVFTWRQMKLTTDLEYFLPQGQGDSRVESDVLRALSHSTLSRRMVFVVSGANQDEVIPAAKTLQAELAKLPLRLSAGEEAAKPLFKELFARRYHLASSHPETELPKLFSNAGLATAVDALKEALASPAGALVRGVAAKDPLLLSRRPIERISALNSSALQLTDGVLMTADGSRAVLFAISNAPAFDSAAQTRLWSNLQTAFERVRAGASQTISIQASALSRHAVAAEKSMRSDVTRVSFVSTAALLLLLWFVFVRLRYLPFMLLPLVAGFLVGTFACLFVFGRIHAMTFAFGSSLIGVCIDYPIFFANHFALQDKSRSTKDVYITVLLGCLTTVFGLSALGWGGLPGLKEIGVFGASGVAAAFVTSVVWMRYAVPASLLPPARHVRISTALNAFVLASLQRRFAGFVIVAAALGLCALGLPRVTWQDDPQKLTVLDPQLEAEDIRVRKAAFGQEGNEFVVLVSNESEQDSLVANDALATALQALVNDGKLGSFSSLHNVMWSESLQQRNLAWFRANLPADTVRAALTNAGFEGPAFFPFGENNADLDLNPLRISDLPKLTYDTFVAPWFLQMPDGRRGLLTRLVDVKDAQALKARIAAVAGARYMNVVDFRSAAYFRFRSRMLLLLGIGLAVVGAFLMAYYRRWRLAVCAFGPAVLSAFTAVATVTLLGQPLNLMHLMGLMLVLSMGADYGIFLVQSLDSKTSLAAPALSIVMACLSTVLSFGLLALSSSPALKAVGQIIGLGIVMAKVFSVALAAMLLHKREGTT